MIKVDKLNVQMQVNAKDIVKETEEAIDSEFKMMVLGGVANSMSDDVDGYISEELVAQKLHEITDRAYAHMGKELN